ncbi:MAG: hypothetical protein KGI57_07705 [Hyphomicrobiales bacterium]|nr:hypothetical protein [Hyphomicrobiales bacterium]MDE2017573.1 hypothetical protein [Hyphomicrobiales bacterium]
MAAALAASAFAFVEVTAGGARAPARRAPARIVQSPTLPKVAGIPEAAYALSIEKPLFDRTRRPWSASASKADHAKVVAAPVRGDAQLQAEFKVLGTIVGPSLREALLSSKAAPDGVWVREGEVFSGWTVAHVDQSGITASAAGDIFRKDVDSASGVDPAR